MKKENIKRLEAAKKQVNIVLDETEGNNLLKNIKYGLEVAIENGGNRE